MKNIILFIVLIFLFGCYTLHKNENGAYIKYKGIITPILKDDENKMYFINEKGKKIRIEQLKSIRDKKPSSF